MRGLRSVTSALAKQRRERERQTRQQLARQHRPMSNQLVEKILDRHGR
jgi:hypothetical protein